MLMLEDVKNFEAIYVCIPLCVCLSVSGPLPVVNRSSMNRVMQNSCARLTLHYSPSPHYSIHFPALALSLPLAAGMKTSQHSILLFLHMKYLEEKSKPLYSSNLAKLTSVFTLFPTIPASRKPSMKLCEINNITVFVVHTFGRCCYLYL